jgi:hypothetical protein
MLSRSLQHGVTIVATTIMPTRESNPSAFSGRLRDNDVRACVGFAHKAALT